MILLIPSFQELNLINLTDLNSIMILLILKELAIECLQKEFKFHYDSINSTLNAPQLISLSIFKFHYDSINSHYHLPYKFPVHI